jgi:hypothetical protein
VNWNSITQIASLVFPSLDDRACLSGRMRAIALEIAGIEGTNAVLEITFEQRIKGKQDLDAQVLYYRQSQENVGSLHKSSSNSFTKRSGQSDWSNQARPCLSRRAIYWDDVIELKTTTPLLGLTCPGPF